MTRVIVVACLVAWSSFAQRGSGTDAPLPHWTIDYSISGGIQGLAQHFFLIDDGQATVTNGFGDFAKKASFYATPDEMATVVAVLRKLKLPEPPKNEPTGPAIPDAIASSIVLAWGGKPYPITSSGPALGAAIRPIMTRGLKQVQR